MHDIINQLLDYVRGVWRHRWAAMIVAWFVCIVGWAVVLKMPDQYSASAKIYVDTDTVLKPLLRGLTVQTDIREQIELMTKALLSRPNLEKLARMTDLDLKAATPEELENLLQRLKRRISIVRVGRKDFYDIAYTGDNPQMAKNVVQSLLTIFVESSLGQGRKDSDMASRFLDDQIRDYENLLIEAENKLKEFKRQNVGLLPSQGGNYYSRLQLTMTSLEEAKLALQEAEKRRNELKNQLADLEAGKKDAVAAAPDALATPEIDQRITSLQERLDGLLLRYTEDHPDVISVRRIIEDLEAQKKQRQELMGANPMATDGSAEAYANPIYQQIKIALAESEANLASASVRVKEYEARVEQLKKMIDTVPEVEAQLIGLTRDYDVFKQNYDTLLSRREAAKMAQRAEVSGDNVMFRVIEPPVVPFEPSGPNRPLFMSIVLAGGAGAGIGFGIFIMLVRATFDDRRKLIGLTGLPVLGEISMFWSPAQQIRRGTGFMVFFLTGLVLAGAFMGLLNYQDLAREYLSALPPLHSLPYLDKLPF